MYCYRNQHRLFFATSFFSLFLFLCCHLLSADSALGDLRSESPVVIAVQKVSDAVVNISSEYEVQSSGTPFSGLRQDPFYDYFFRDFFEPGFRRNVKRSSLGSGVIIDGSRGFVLTNAHVIAKSGTIHVLLKDNREFEAKIVGADNESDLAVLKLSLEEELPSVEMGNSDDLLIGETVIAIGNPFGFSNSVTTGVVSALNRTIRTEDVIYHDFIQTDASINPGNSGGPLLNINGELIGINTAIYANAQGLGFAIPISKARRIINDLIKYGEVVQAWIGLSPQTLDNQLSDYLSVEGKTGVLVTSVFPNGPADQAGITVGDIIVSLENRPISSREDYQSALKIFAAGDTISVKYLHKGRLLNTDIRASLFPPESALDLAYELYGIHVSNIVAKNRNWRQSRSVDGVLITTVAPNTYLARIGVSSGDIIHAIDEMTISNMEDFKKAVVKYRLKNTVVLLIERSGRLYNVTVKLS